MSDSTATKRASRAMSPPSKAADSAKKQNGDAKEGEKAAAAGTNYKPLVILAVVGAAAFGLYYAFGHKVNIPEQMERAVKFVEAQGETAMYWYCAITLVGVICLIPTTPMEIAGGFLFSPTYGWPMVLVYTGTMKLIANIVSVMIARFVVKDWVMKNVVSKYELLTMVSKAVKEEPWKMAFLVRGSMVPLAVKNYGLGVMDIGLGPIAVCSCIFTNFYAFQNIYMGSAMQDIKEVFAPKTAAAGPTDWTANAKKLMPVAFNVLLVIFLIKAVKAQIKKQKAAIEANLEKKIAKDGDKKAD